MARVLSGIQPSGNLHIGNYFAMMKRMIEMQTEHEMFVFIVNYHALTSVSDGAVLKKGTLDAVMDFLALGLDPGKVNFWVQSDIPEVTELTWILNTVTPVGLLERCHSYKDKIAKGIAPSTGLFSYPVLMAADILMMQSEIVPVGKDQKQHVEVARDIAIKFNNIYGETFVLPEPDIPKEIATIPGVDGQKMSKSYGNTIDIFAPVEEIKKKVMSIVTDSISVEAPKDPDKCVVFNIFKLFLNEREEKELRERYERGGTGYGDIKKELAVKVVDYFEAARVKRTELARKPDYIREVLQMGKEKARAIAMPTVELVREKVGIL